MAEYKHGSMNIETQERTFESFIKIAAYGAITAILVLIFLALVNG